MSKKLIIAIIFIVFILGGGWLLLRDRNQLEDFIKIGAILPLSSSTGSSYGEYAQLGLELALEEINSKGGVNGKKLKIIYEDSKGEPKIGLEAINKLI